MLAQLDAELIEGVDAPQHRLRVNAVLVHGDQAAQGLRGQRIEQDQRAGPAARIRAVRILAALPVRQRFGLRQQVGHQRQVVFGVRIVIADGADEIQRHDTGALVQRLEEAVLHVGARAAPPDRHGVLANRAAVQLHRLAQAFHHQLLQIRRQ